MMYIPVTIFRLFTSLYMLSVPVTNSVATISQQYVDYSRLTSTAIALGQATPARSRYQAGCELEPNFRCASGDYCIPVKLVLNGYKDCPDASDEDARKVDFCNLGPAFHNCGTNSRCITTSVGYRCQCDEGYTGDGFYCERFPMGIQITVSTNDTLEDTPVHFNISILVFPTGQNSNLSLTVIGLPQDAKFDIGSPCNASSWCFTEEDFSFGTYINGEFFPPRDFSGVIPLTIIAEIYRDGYWVTGYSATSLTVIGMPDSPILRVGTVCFPSAETSEISIPVRAALADVDGSEELEIDFDGLPDGFDISTWTDQTAGEVANMSADVAVTTFLITADSRGMFPFNATISAVAKEKSTGQENVTSKTVMVVECPPQPNMSVIFDIPSEELEGNPVPFHITVKFELEESPRLISIQLINFPLGASLSRGVRVGNSSVWALSRQDLADDGLLLFPPPYFSGRMELYGQSEAMYRGFSYNLNSTAVIEITPVATTPILHVDPEVICLPMNATNMMFVIEAELVDADGSENIIVQYNIPEEWMGSVGDAFHGSYSVMSEGIKEKLNVSVTNPNGFLYPVEIPVVAMAIEKENADQKIVFTRVRTVVCDGLVQGFNPRSMQLFFDEITGEVFDATNPKCQDSMLSLCHVSGDPLQWCSEAFLYFHSQVRQRTTIIWNVTTPASTFPSSSDDGLHSTFLHEASSSLIMPNASTSDKSSTSAQMLFPNHSSRNSSEKSSAVPEEAVSTVDNVHQFLDSAQDDESPRFNRNLSFLPLTSFQTTKSPITRSPLKVQRLAKLAEDPSTRPSRPNRPNKKPKSKQPQVPGRAELDGVILEQFASVANGTEDTLIEMNITVITKNAPLYSAVRTRIYGLPVGSNLTRGRQENETNTWILEHRELGVLFLQLPEDFSGKFSVTVASTLNLHKNKVLTAKETFEVRIGAETDGGILEITSPYFQLNCVKQSDREMRFTVHVRLKDNDGSEEVEHLELRGLPRGARVDPGRILGTDLGYIIFGRELPTFNIRSDRNFPVFNLVFDAKVRERTTGVKVAVTKIIPIVPCSGASKLGEAIRSLQTGELFSFQFVTAFILALIKQRIIL